VLLVHSLKTVILAVFYFFIIISGSALLVKLGNPRVESIFLLYHDVA
jgi:hypothetical protein